MRAALFMAALALGAAGCGKSKRKGKAKPATCDEIALTAVRDRLAAVKEQPPAGTRGLPPRILGADGAGRTTGAARLTYFEDDKGDVYARVGDHPPVLAGEAGSSKTLLFQLLGAIDDAPAPVIEIETFAELSPIALRPLLTAFAPHVELHLIVDEVETPPVAGVAPWAIDLYAGLKAVPSDERAATLKQGLGRAMGAHCGQFLETVVVMAQQDHTPLRPTLPRALAECRCKDADLVTSTWLFELLLLRTYRPAWLRLRIDTGGARLADAETIQDVARGLAALTPAQRTLGVWIP